MTKVTTSPLVLAVNPSTGFKTVQDVQDQFANTWAQGTTVAQTHFMLERRWRNRTRHHTLIDPVHEAFG